MNPKSIKYIDTRQVRRTMCNVTFETDLVYQAHSIKKDHLIPYVPKADFDALLDELVKLKEKNVTNEKA